MVLTLNNLGKTYPHPRGDVTVLEGVDARFGKGEAVAIIGPSGSGKSTLLGLMAGLDRPSTGTIHCLDQDLAQLDERGLARFRSRNFGIVFQQFHLMAHLTAWENVSLPLELAHSETASEAARKALETVGLGDRLGHFPRELSGGECQRVAIARAFVTQPALLLADEPSGNLDPATGGSVMDLLFGQIRDQAATLILVTHDERLAARCDRKLTLREGRLHDG